MYYIIAVCVVFLGLSIYRIWFIGSWAGWEEVGMLMCFTVMAVFVLLIPMIRSSAYSQLAKRDVLQASYNSLRANPLEMATVGKEIAEWNAWLASAKYWNQTQWDWYWPDDVMTADPIR